METTSTSIFEAVLSSEAFSDFLSTYNSGTSILLALGTIGIVIAMVINMAKFGASQDNPQARSQAQNNIWITGICFSIICSIDFFYLLIVNFILN